MNGREHFTRGYFAGVHDRMTECSPNGYQDAIEPLYSIGYHVGYYMPEYTEQESWAVFVAWFTRNVVMRSANGCWRYEIGSMAHGAFYSSTIFTTYRKAHSEAVAKYRDWLCLGLLN